MKAVIVECSNGAAVALCDDGSFRRIHNRNYSIGQELLLKPVSTRNRTMRRLSICASLALFISAFAGIGSYSYVNPYSYVSLDINPSIEYALNRYDKVIRVAGINDDGKHVVSSIESDVKNQTITTALDVTIQQLEKDSYITQEADNHVIISVCSDNDSKAEAIASTVNTFSTEEVTVCSIQTVTVSKEVKSNADSLGITPGKLALIHAVEESIPDEDFDVSEWKDKSVSELETTIQQASSKNADAKSAGAGKAGNEENTGKDTVIDSEYLSTMLDDTVADNHADSAATTSKSDAGSEEPGSSTDRSKAASDAGTSTSKHADASADKAAAQEPEGSGTTSKSDASTTQKPSADIPASDASAAGEPVTEEPSAPEPSVSNDTGEGTTSRGSDAENTTTKPDTSNTTTKKDSTVKDNGSSTKDSAVKDAGSSAKDSGDYTSKTVTDDSVSDAHSVEQSRTEHSDAHSVEEFQSGLSDARSVEEFQSRASNDKLGAFEDAAGLRYEGLPADDSSTAASMRSEESISD